jgi:uncharacterized membrane protein YqjE
MGARPSLAPAEPAARGLLDALRAIGSTLNEMVRVRGSLFAVELREEVQRRKEMLALAVVGVVCLHLALVLLTLLVAVVFWDTYRIAAIGAMTGIYLACGAIAFAKLRSRIAASPDPFAATLGELERDLADLGARR